VYFNNHRDVNAVMFILTLTLKTLSRYFFKKNIKCCICIVFHVNGSCDYPCDLSVRGFVIRVSGLILSLPFAPTMCSLLITTLLGPLYFSGRNKNVSEKKVMLVAIIY